MVGGASEPSPGGYAGWDRLGTIVNSLQFIFGGFDDNLQISFDFLGGFEEKAYFCGKLYKLNNRR